MSENDNGNPCLYYFFILLVLIAIGYMGYIASKPPEGSIDPDTCPDGCVVMGRCGTKEECDDTSKIKIFLWLTAGLCIFMSLLGCCSWIFRKRAQSKSNLAE